MAMVRTTVRQYISISIEKLALIRVEYEGRGLACQEILGAPGRVSMR
jgi:hypothetical protein